MSVNSIGQTKEEDRRSFQDDHEDETREVVSNRGFMKHHCYREGYARYAIKQLRPSLKGIKRADGTIDLSIEAKFLSVLSHPNVIKLCGMSKMNGHPKSFLILDRLYDTLSSKMSKWRSRKAKYDGWCRKNVRKLSMIWDERLLAMYDVARAMKYIHSHDIIYRDLKPDNIGFDVHGNAKIFDFGLAKELLDKDKVSEDQYKASGQTGTRRYMAPEVVLCQNYGKPIDVFSFAILFWEVLSLQQPFAKYDREKHSALVVKKGKRPRMNKRWPTLIKHVMSSSWDVNPIQRPTFSSICSSISGEMISTGGNGEDGLLSRTEHLMNASSTARYVELGKMMQE